MLGKKLNTSTENNDIFNVQLIHFSVGCTNLSTMASKRKIILWEENKGNTINFYMSNGFDHNVV